MYFKFEKKWIENTLILIGISALIPLIILSIYTQPCNDDYNYALRDISTNFIYAGIDTYLNFSGRYFATFISRLNPLIYHSLEAYKIYTIILLCVFLFAMYYLVSTLSSKTLNKREKIALTALLFIVYIIQCPSISQSFYWFSGYAAYTFPSILLIWLFGSLLKSTQILRTILNILLVICIAGSNEISTVILFCTLAFINIEWRLQHNKKWNRSFLLLWVVAAICTLIVVLSPGNAVRMQGETSSNNIIWTIGGSILQTLSWFPIWGSVLLMISIIYIPLFGKRISESTSEKLHLLFSIKIKHFLLFFIITLFLTHIPPTWGLGTVAIGRLANAIYVFFILCWLYLTQLIINRYPGIITLQNNKYYQFIYLAFFFFFTFNTVYNIDGNIMTSYVDLITGKARKYYLELNKRHLLLKDNQSTEKVIKIPGIETIPKTIYFKDISSDKDSWENETYRTYWNCCPQIYIEDTPKIEYSNMEYLKLFMKEIRKNNFSRTEE